MQGDSWARSMYREAALGAIHARSRATGLLFELRRLAGLSAGEVAALDRAVCSTCAKWGYDPVQVLGRIYHSTRREGRLPERTRMIISAEMARGGENGEA